MAGPAAPAGRDVGRPGNELLALLRERRACRALSLRRGRRGDARPRHGAHRVHVALLPAGRGSRPALRLPRARPVRPAPRASVQPRQAPRRRVRQVDRRPDPVRCGQRAALRSGRPRCRSRGGRRGRCRRDPEVCRRRRELRLGGRPQARDPMARDGDLRDACEGVHEAAPGRARGSPRHVRGPRVGGGDRVPEVPGRDGCRALAGSSHRRRALPRGAWADELLGLLHDRVPRPARAVRRHRHARRAGARVQRNGQGAPRRRARGDPGRRLQPHRRGQPSGSDALVQGHRQRVVLPAAARRPQALPGLHGHRKQLQPRAPERVAADHGLAPLLRGRVPCRRLPLRPRLGARARVLRRRPPRRLLRHHPSGSGALRGRS